MNKSKVTKNKELPTINRIAVVLKEERRSNRWLATEIGFTETTVSKWATNAKQPNIFVFYLIALVLRRELKDLFVSTADINEKERSNHLEILKELVDQGKRTGKSRR